jgi:hypothetical protein
MFSIDHEAPRSYPARPACAEIETMAKPVNENESVAVAIQRLEEARKPLGRGAIPEPRHQVDIYRSRADWL